MIFDLLIKNNISSIGYFNKTIPNDVVLFICSLIAGVLFVLSNMNSVYKPGQIWWIVCPFACFLIVPLFYSMYVQSLEKKAGGV